MIRDGESRDSHEVKLLLDQIDSIVVSSYGLTDSELSALLSATGGIRREDIDEHSPRQD